MEKDFYAWNEIKASLQRRESFAEGEGAACYSREIWMCSIGINVGSEVDGKNESFSRPVLVYKVFNMDMFWGIPLTTKTRSGDFYFTFNLGGVDNTAVLSQLRLFSTKRLDRKITVMPKDLFELLQIKLRRLV
jgi:mRNA interferase MazF